MANLTDLAYEWKAVFIMECLVKVELANGITNGCIVITLQNIMTL